MANSLLIIFFCFRNNAFLNTLFKTGTKIIMILIDNVDILVSYSLLSTAAFDKNSGKSLRGSTSSVMTTTFLSHCMAAMATAPIEVMIVLPKFRQLQACAKFRQLQVSSLCCLNLGI